MADSKFYKLTEASQTLRNPLPPPSRRSEQQTAPSLHPDRPRARTAHLRRVDAGLHRLPHQLL